MIARPAPPVYLDECVDRPVIEAFRQRGLDVLTALVVEAFLPGESAGPLPASGGVRVVAGVLLGLPIALVSSLLVVAGGEPRPAC